MKLAYLVGIESYEHLSPALYARNDVVALADALVEHCGFARGDVKVEKDLVSKEQIETHLKQLAAAATHADTFLFYFAGHGLHRANTSYLIGHEGEDDPDRAIDGAGVSLESAIEAASQVGARATIVICDCCRQEPLPSRSPGDNLMPRQMEETCRYLVPQFSRDERAMAILLGCCPGQRTWADPESLHGAFTSALIDAIGGNGASIDGLVTIYSVAAYVASRLREWSDQNPAKAMTSFLSSQGEIVLGKSGGTPPPPLPPPEAFHFSDGERVNTMREWFEWLTKEPARSATQLRQHTGVRSWLAQFIHPQAAKIRADELRRQSEGIWRPLRTLAHRVERENEPLLSRLRSLEALVEDMTHLSDSIGDYFSDRQRLDTAARLDRHNPRVAGAYALLEERIRSHGRGRERTAALDEVRALVQQRQWEAAIRLLAILARVSTLEPAETAGIEGSEGRPVEASVAGVTYVRLPAGIVRLATGRLVATRAFLISKQPVTVDQYARAGALPSIYPPDNPRWLLRDRPIVLVNWADAQRYCERVGGWLPSEAEWECGRRFAANDLCWPPLVEWCHDVFRDPPLLTPAVDPGQDAAGGAPNDRRVVRRSGAPRAGRRDDAIGDDLTFRVVLPGGVAIDRPRSTIKTTAAPAPPTA